MFILLFVSLFVFVPTALPVRTCIPPAALWAINLKYCLLFIYLFIYIIEYFYLFIFLYNYLFLYLFIHLFLYLKIIFVTASLPVRVYTFVHRLLFLWVIYFKNFRFFFHLLFMY